MNCTTCKKEIDGTSRFCPHCGTELGKETTQVQEVNVEKIENNSPIETTTSLPKETENLSPVAENEPKEKVIDLQKESAPETALLSPQSKESGEEEKPYAGFWIRFLANFVDGIVSFIFILIPILVVGAIDIITRPDAEDLSFFTYFFIFFMLYPVQLLYYVLLECGSWQGTLGKKLCGLIVENERGEKLSWKTSLFRNLMKLIFLQYFAVVLIAPAFTKKKQNPHDIFANTYVLHK